MDQIFMFMGSLLTKMNAQEGSLGWTVVLFTACVILFMLVSISSETRCLQLAEHIRPLHEHIANKLQNSPDKMGKDLVQLHSNFGYHTMLGVSSNLIHVVIAFLLAGTFFGADTYLSDISLASRSFLWIQDLAQSPLYLLLNGYYFPGLVLAAVGLLLLDTTMSINFRHIIRKSLMPMDTLYKAISTAILAACFVLPQAVMVYFIVYYLLKNIIVKIYLRFFPYQFSVAQQVLYSDYAKKYKMKRNEE